MILWIIGILPTIGTCMIMYNYVLYEYNVNEYNQ